ncbi:MAG: carbon-nitrogen hydrolase family protein [Cyclobacteriaceae bacterium]|nr:carbon-nitrogen hydrolase family protein [Cyclobacteriaceae bacterium]
MNINNKKEDKLPREVVVASIDLRGIWPVDTIEERINDILRRMENVYVFEPDLICLPETFQTSWVREERMVEDYAEDETTPGPVTSIIAEEAKKQNSYIVCPLVTKKDGHYYNSAILINRKGEIEGVYHKAHLVPSEIEEVNLTPGTLEPLVFNTDFGKVGMQICYDANWFDCWEHLKKQGAEIICFPSQAPFINVLKHHAWINQAYIVSSTGEGSRIIDITGDEIAVSGQFERWVCDTINLEKVLIHVWPYIRKVKDIREKYRQKVKIKIYHPENWITIESRDPDVKVHEILKEFEISTFDGHLKKNEIVQDEYRP